MVFNVIPVRETSGFGNRLSVYWYGRSISFWEQKGFEMPQQMRDNWIGSYQTTFLPYLPMRTLYTSNWNNSTDENLSDSATLLFKEKLKKLGVSFELIYEMRYPHSSAFLLTFYNRYFLPILRQDTRKAIAEYFQSKNNSDVKTIHNESLSSKNSIIAIHFRCGDILFGHELYHFMTLNYYLHIFDQILAEMNSNSTTELNIYIISQLSTNGVHRHSDQVNLPSCRRLVSAFRDKLHEHYANHHVNLTFQLINNNIVSDFNLMMHVPYLICGTSTFCLHAAIAGNNLRSFLPDIGPWSFLSQHVNETIQSEILPPTHSIINVSLNKWFLESTLVFKKKWHKSNKFSNLIDYILSH
ncbi:hypothetical protein RFI_14654 [Reticulomyxa filosa]|uniref:Uncharacterized protein n=1 Tax=Reticulomyxa filosa TaxID=46433 RepID=X6N925_RETFI|nr:hypothetical protein RFI_14654 [Reticulomyxa filosa]|eukprot:ETO22551.1 hypothetical protein RFI_14654 [Reticulomyxa filosa]